MNKFFHWGGALLLAGLLTPINSQANVVITGTRVIYNQSDREVTVKMDNVGQEPALVQVWADRGAAKSSPTKADAPFLITPPIFRIDPSKGQSIRLIFSGADLPRDRESVFWLNMLDIPPAPSKGQQNYLQMAIQTRIKIFYRPSKLPGSPDEAAEKLNWHIISQGNEQFLRVQNSTPYHVSINFAAIEVNGQEYRTDSGMVPPLGSIDLKIKDLKTKPASSSSIKFESINDYGGPIILKAAPLL
ncbi:fimbria/pilus periplasmic chaperone [Vogesella sp. LIG4]|uniref:fimbria/pilus periplasmic chaperone n=1 Tax=Vogesella sp. LIG4 TaxID=1192162 RepID=UPI00081F8917|nr:fimbria/pilus periplasmic chaperone [Vogesella sp. LIG4]SCK16976.1 chaperone protein EcpD [Vogesella sp. LIG4]